MLIEAIEERLQQQAYKFAKDKAWALRAKLSEVLKELDGYPPDHIEEAFIKGVEASWYKQHLEQLTNCVAAAVTAQSIEVPKPTPSEAAAAAEAISKSAGFPDA